jgi:HPt (histidine-containing phosphotransfer) domain-containing protein
MDIMMPKMNGVEALNNLKSIIGFKMPVVALTADVIAGMEDKYISQGFDDCLPKPIVEEQLYYMLRKYLKESVEATQKLPVVSSPIVQEQKVELPELPATIEPAIDLPTTVPVVPQQSEIELPQVVQPVVEIPAMETPREEPTPSPSIEIIPGEPHSVELLKNNKIDVDAGIELLKDMEMYDMTLEEFYNELQNKLTDLEKYKSEGNMEDYAILAHALKTEARYVGCNELGDMAYEHELAGKTSNQALVDEKFEELSKEVNRVYDVVKRYFGN